VGNYQKKFEQGFRIEKKIVQGHAKCQKNIRGKTKNNSYTIMGAKTNIRARVALPNPSPLKYLMVQPLKNEKSKSYFIA